MMLMHEVMMIMLMGWNVSACLTLRCYISLLHWIDYKVLCYVIPKSMNSALLYIVRRPES